MTREPTGRRETRQGRDAIVLSRTFHAPIETVWASVSASDRLVAAQTNGDVAAVDFDDYYPTQSGHYRELVCDRLRWRDPALELIEDVATVR